MPSRTNEFQRLVTILHSQLAPGWTVTESKALNDRVLDDGREVDVVIEGNAGTYPVVLCIECRDRSRAADVTWVEEMHTKHEHLPTNKLVLAGGFWYDPWVVTVGGGLLVIAIAALVASFL